MMTKRIIAMSMIVIMTSFTLTSCYTQGQKHGTSKVQKSNSKNSRSKKGH